VSLVPGFGGRAGDNEPMTDRGSWSGLFPYVLAVLTFGALAVSAVDHLRQEGTGLGVPFLIAGVAGATGAAVVGAAIYWRLGARIRRATRTSMIIAAMAVAGTGVALAPDSTDHAFVIGAAALLALLLAGFALLAGPGRRV
jgi:hypothetical protein